MSVACRTFQGYKVLTRQYESISHGFLLISILGITFLGLVSTPICFRNN